MLWTNGDKADKGQRTAPKSNGIKSLESRKQLGKTTAVLHMIDIADHLQESKQPVYLHFTFPHLSM